MRIKISILLVMFVTSCSRQEPIKQPMLENNVITEQKEQSARKEDKTQEEQELSPREKNKAIVEKDHTKLYRYRN